MVAEINLKKLYEDFSQKRKTYQEYLELEKKISRIQKELNKNRKKILLWKKEVSLKKVVGERQSILKNLAVYYREDSKRMGIFLEMELVARVIENGETKFEKTTFKQSNLFKVRCNDKKKEIIGIPTLGEIPIAYYVKEHYAELKKLIQELQEEFKEFKL